MSREAEETLKMAVTSFQPSLLKKKKKKPPLRSATVLHTELRHGGNTKLLSSNYCCNSPRTPFAFFGFASLRVYIWSKDVARLSIFLFRGITTKPVAHGFASSTSMTTNGPRCPLAISTVDILNEKGRIVSPCYNLSVNGNF